MRLLLLGATGRLGRHVREVAPEAVAPTRRELDLETVDEAALREALRGMDAVLNCAAEANVDACEVGERGPRMNTRLPALLAAAAEAEHVALLHVSTDYVFGGPEAPVGPFSEDAVPGPAQRYGQTKAEGEAAVLAAGGRRAVARVSWLFGPTVQPFAGFVLGQEAPVEVLDQASRPTWLPDLARWLVAACGRLAADVAVPPILHPAGGPHATREDWARAVLQAAGRQDPIHIGPAPQLPADRPADSRLDATRTRAWERSARMPAIADWRDRI